ncbi:hypothetical protein LCGC14_0501560 [marine sediment metagenome]|uniref:Uncharacterized protein n=1 Tax=marine sediment metagenome TaxID=412755 RepID=A0A0F9S3T2_9ZZZZ
MTTEVSLSYPLGIRKEKTHVWATRWTRYPYCWRAGRHPCLHLLPGAAGSGRLGVQRGLDRQFNGVGTVPPDLHRCGIGGDVLRLATHFPASTEMQAGRGLRDPAGANRLQAHFLDRSRVGLGRARFPLCHAIFLLIRSSP